jgi:uncharacterized protein (DUF1499 family)
MCNLLKGTRPKYLGVKDGPNCVSSQADRADTEHYIEPLKYNSLNKPTQVIEQLEALIDGLGSNPEVIEHNESYLYVEFTTPLLGFCDDVEFFATDDGLIHVRSASRLGYSDLGANRKRIEEIRQKWVN